MINSIALKNFTVFEDCAIEFASGVNVFIGENGTGKTHLLKMIYGLGKSETDMDLMRLNDRYFPTPHVETKDFLKQNVIPVSFGKEDIQVLLRYNDSKTVVYQASRNGSFIYGGRDVGAKLDAVFIPAKEMLSMATILRIHDKYSKGLSLDETFTDIIRKAQGIKPDEIPELAKSAKQKLEIIIGGIVSVDKDGNFGLVRTDGEEVPFTMAAEGFRKLGLLWQLLMNESIAKNSILLWDEPEANISPIHLPTLVEILLDLSRNGVQVFLATHSYNVAKLLETSKKQDDNLLFHSLYKTQNGVKSDSARKYKDVIDNSIEKGENILYNAVVAKGIERIEEERENG